MKHFTSKNQKTGELGEEICTQWLNKNGFTIIERNFTQKEGEIDIITLKDDIYHFIEVKSVSCVTTDDINHETIYNPLQNVTREKIQKCFKVINNYKNQKRLKNEVQFDVYAIYIDKRNIKHKIERIENVF